MAGIHTTMSIIRNFFIKHIVWPKSLGSSTVLQKADSWKIIGDIIYKTVKTLPNYVFW